MKNIETSINKLNNEKFLKKAPEDIILKERSRKLEASELLVKLEESIAKLGRLP